MILKNKQITHTPLVGLGGIGSASNFCNYLTLGMGCGLVGGAQIVRQKDTVLHWIWCCCKAIAGGLKKG
jgi:hypothetical protein